MDQSEIERIAGEIARSNMGRFSKGGQNYFLTAVEKLLVRNVPKEERILSDFGNIAPLEAIFVEDMARRAVDKYRKDHGLPDPAEITETSDTVQRVAFRGLTGAQAYLLESILYLGNPSAREVRDYCEREKEHESWKSSVSSYRARIRLMMEYKYVVHQSGRYSVTELGKTELDKYNSR